MEFDEAKLQEYIDNAKVALKFFLSCHQWDGIKQSTIDNWLNNFPDTLVDRYYAYRLLSNILYYSEQDLVFLLEEGIWNKVLGKELLSKRQIPSNFGIAQYDLQYDFRDELSKTLFVPLLDADAPYESGNQIVRLLVQQLDIPTNQVIQASRINDSHTRFERLIIVDDCIGSGDQCRQFWEETEVGRGKLLREWCRDNNIKAYYVVLVGYSENINSLSKEFDDLEICCVELLKDEHRAFSPSSNFWENKEETEAARMYFERITQEAGIPLLGHRGMDFAVIMHLNIPDWSLPLFWRKNSDWKILMKRKNSNG